MRDHLKSLTASAGFGIFGSLIGGAAASGPTSLDHKHQIVAEAQITAGKRGVITFDPDHLFSSDILAAVQDASEGLAPVAFTFRGLDWVIDDQMLRRLSAGSGLSYHAG